MDFRTAEILGLSGELDSVDIVAKALVLLHLGGLNIEDLHTTSLVGEGDLDLDFETTWAEQRLVEHIFAIGHANDQDVVELLNTVHLGKQLVHDRITDTSAVAARATLLADGIDLIKDDDVETRVFTLGFVLTTSLLKKKKGENNFFTSISASLKRLRMFSSA